MDGETLVELLKDLYSARNNSDLAKKLIGVKGSATIGNWERGNVTKAILRNVLTKVIKKERNLICGEEFIEYIKRKHKKVNDSEVANLLGFTNPALTNWKKTGIGIRKISEMIEKSKSAHTRNLIEPIVEFYPLNKTKSRQGAKFEILDQKATAIRNELNNSNGIYMFYDSRGKAIYAGKAKNQTLWAEMNNAFNRKRKLQELKRVSHLKKGGKTKNGQITKQQVLIHDIASYFSAYTVTNGFINNLEATIIRLFSNDLLNGKVERIKKKT